MRRALALSLLLNATLVAGLLWQRSPIAHGGAVASQNGDVNGDGRLDIADGIYIINHQFRGGPPPMPIECPPPTANGLPDTGQTKCYDAAGAEIPCDSAACSGQDGAYATGCPSEGRFVDNGDGTVTDRCTGLMWQQAQFADVNGNGQIDLLDAVDWCSALAFCDALVLAGHEDWRLPNIRELQSIVDYGLIAPACDPILCEPPPHGFLYWSSTSYVGVPISAFFMNPTDGSTATAPKDTAGHGVRAVRTAP